MVSLLVNLRGSALISYGVQLQCLRGLVIGLKSQVKEVQEKLSYLLISDDFHRNPAYLKKSELW